jgi:hypothetical protein
VSHDNSTMTVWIEAENWASGEWTPDNDSTDVIVTLEDGSRRIATFISYKYVNTLTERYRKSGENISGAYLWIRDMILIDEISRPRIEEVIKDLFKAGDFEVVFRLCSDEEREASF